MVAITEIANLSQGCGIGVHGPTPIGQRYACWARFACREGPGTYLCRERDTQAPGTGASFTSTHESLLA